MESTNLKGDSKNKAMWLVVVAAIFSWLVGYIMASVMKDIQYGSAQGRNEQRQWERIDSVGRQVDSLGRGLAELQAKAPSGYPPPEWLEDIFRPLVERVTELEQNK